MRVIEVSSILLSIQGIRPRHGPMYYDRGQRINQRSEMKIQIGTSSGGRTEKRWQASSDDPVARMLLQSSGAQGWSKDPRPQ